MITDPRLMELQRQLARQGSLRNDPRSVMNEMDDLNAQDSIGRTQDRWSQFPGSRPGGTGMTGLQSNDSRGWAAMQNNNLESIQAMSDGPLQVRGNYGGTDFARQQFSVGGGMDAHQEQRARLLEAMLLNQGDEESLRGVGVLRGQKGRW